MKGLSVLKKYFVACSLFVSCLLNADALGDILSSKKTLLFEYQLQSNEQKSDKLSKSWIRPIMLEYRKNYTTQFGNRTIDTATFSVSINQPIFKFGGIYYGIKYADALRHANRSSIELQNRKRIGDAVTILFNVKKSKLEQKKLALLLKNDKIDIRQKRDSYTSGLLDSSFLDKAILKKSQDEANLLESQLRILELKEKFSLLSDKNPETLKLPLLKPVTKKVYHTNNIQLQSDKLNATVTRYKQKITWAKYLPTIALQGQYIDGDINPLFTGPNSTLKEQYYTYGFSVSMPLDINTFSDIEESKVEKLKAAVQVLDSEESVDKEYEWIEKSLQFIEQKINLAKKEEKVYQNLYHVTQNLQKIGEKTSLDSATMHNSLQIKKIDKKIYEIDKQLYLLKLYIRMKNVL